VFGWRLPSWRAEARALIMASQPLITDPVPDLRPITAPEADNDTGGPSA
jgi:hypothetical protein